MLGILIPLIGGLSGVAWGAYARGQGWSFGFMLLGCVPLGVLTSLAMLLVS